MGKYADNPPAVIEREGRPTPQRGRKDRRRWCRGKVGVDHVPEIVMSHHGTWLRTYRNAQLVCGWKERHRWEITVDTRTWTGTGEWKWHCVHEERCSNCGRVMGVMGLGERCPDYVALPAGK